MLFTLPISLVALAFQALLVAAFSGDLVRRNSSGFVSVQDGAFQLDGRFYRFYGTNAYWAHTMTDNELNTLFSDIANAGFRVVRTWAFNDVPSKPASGPYFQILSGGSATVNEGPDGLQRLDKVVACAQKYGIRLILTLTNNWNPERPAPASGIPRGSLQNDYGGIDAYIRNFKPGGTHDLFYTHPIIIDAFKYYVKAVVSRYASNPTILAWELGNDLRCSSTVPASPDCNPKTITQWAAKISGYIKELDNKHLITTGDSGFFCLECPKLFANTSTPKRPALEGPSFDGSFGIDTEDLVSIPSIDFGSFQISPEQMQLFPAIPGADKTDQLLGNGGRWIEVHSQTTGLSEKPQVLLSAGVLTKSNCKFFVANDQVEPQPENVACYGVEDFEATYAVSSWGSASLNGNVNGVLEANWIQIQPGLSRRGTMNRRQEPGRYDGAATNLNTRLFALDAPPV
ncbi:hypothetical protein H1R20_g11829, partial [Candolleomyces eurysporus]